jgi:hypothetical protein
MVRVGTLCAVKITGTAAPIRRSPVATPAKPLRKSLTAADGHAMSQQIAPPCRLALSLSTLL